MRAKCRPANAQCPLCDAPLGEFPGVKDDPIESPCGGCKEPIVARLLPSDLKENSEFEIVRGIWGEGPATREGKVRAQAGWRFFLALSRPLEFREKELPPFDEVADLVVDREGNAYFVAEDPDSSKWFVISASPAGELRWQCRELPFTYDDDARLCAAPGEAWLWSPKKHSIVRIDAATGVAGELLGAKKRPLDLASVTDLACDADGSILVFGNNALSRFSPRGEAMETWPQKESILGRLKTHFGGWSNPEQMPIFAAGSRFRTVCTEYGRMAVGWDGLLYFVHGGGVSVFDRQGTRQAGYDLDPLGGSDGRAVADLKGNVFLLMDIPDDKDRGRRSLLRLPPRGERGYTVLAKAYTQGGVLDAEAHLAVAPDGSTWVADPNHGVVRAFAPDGSLRFSSLGALERDREHEEERNRKRQNDED